MEGIVAIFDFDKTIIDVDSDNWVVDELGFTELFNQLLPTLPWNTLMDTMMKKMHEQGVGIDQIADVLTRIPIHPRVVPAIKAAHSLGCDLRIVSDANTFFIETILDHLGLRDYFSEINTNPSFVDEKGRLRIHPHHDFTHSSHGCCNPSCPPNMCKGEVIKRILSEEGNKRITYSGDGAGDYCPSLKLRDGDHVLPRKDFPVWNLISANPSLIRAKIHEWSNGAELEQVLLSTIRDMILKGDYNKMSQFMNVDCKLQTMPKSSSHDLPTKIPDRRSNVCNAKLRRWCPRSRSFGILSMKMPWESRGTTIMPILSHQLPLGTPQPSLLQIVWR